MSPRGVIVATSDLPIYSRDEERWPSKPILKVSPAPADRAVGTSSGDLRPKPASYGPAAGVIVGLVSIALLHHLIPHSSAFWHSFFQWLYYVPVVYAASHFGVRGSVSAAAFASIGHLPHVLAAARHSPELVPSRLAEIVVMLIVALVTGLLADRAHRSAKELHCAITQLRQARDELRIRFEQLRRSDRLAAVGELASSMAHEIRNPLSSVRGAVRILQQPGIADDLRLEFLELLGKESGRLEHLLTNILDFARPRSPDCQMVQICTILTPVMTLVSPTAAQNGVRLRADIAIELPDLECDPEQVTQVVLNLILNAIQAMPEGGEIVLIARSLGSRILIQVKDEGTGVEEENLARIFDPFFTTKDNGTGIGLSVAQQIILQHEGSLTAERNKGGGMTFSIFLPLHQHNDPVNSNVPCAVDRSISGSRSAIVGAGAGVSP